MNNLKIFKNMTVTTKIIIANVVLFLIAEILSSVIPGFYDYVSMRPEFIIQGKYLWTILTSMFMHGGFAHLFFNMFSLWFVGRFVERIIGSKRFLVFYLISGIVAGIFFSILSGFFGFGVLANVFGNPAIPGLGASGALFGLIGLVAMLTPKNRVYLIVGPLIAIVLQAIIESLIDIGIISTVLNLLISVYIFVSIFAIFSFNSKMRRLAVPVEMPFWLLPIIAIVPLVLIGLFVNLPIGNMAHLGGLIAGLVYGFYLRQKYKKKVKLLNRYFSK